MVWVTCGWVKDHIRRVEATQRWSSGGLGVKSASAAVVAVGQHGTRNRRAGGAAREKRHQCKVHHQIDRKRRVELDGRGQMKKVMGRTEERDRRRKKEEYEG